jgi:hypothetical protein
LGAQEEEAKVLVIFYFFCFVMGDVCISVLNRLQYLVALEGRMPKGVDGCIFEG